MKQKILEFIKARWQGVAIKYVPVILGKLGIALGPLGWLVKPLIVFFQDYVNIPIGRSINRLKTKKRVKKAKAYLKAIREINEAGVYMDTEKAAQARQVLVDEFKEAIDKSLTFCLILAVSFSVGCSSLKKFHWQTVRVPFKALNLDAGSNACLDYTMHIKKRKIVNESVAVDVDQCTDLDNVIIFEYEDFTQVLSDLSSNMEAFGSVWLFNVGDKQSIKTNGKALSKALKKVFDEER